MEIKKSEAKKKKKKKSEKIGMKILMVMFHLFVLFLFDFVINW